MKRKWKKWWKRKMNEMIAMNNSNNKFNVDQQLNLQTKFDVECETY